LNWKWGYPLVLAFMAALCLLLYRNLRRNNWL
jgi:magnesium transporter